MFDTCTHLFRSSETLGLAPVDSFWSEIQRQVIIILYYIRLLLTVAQGNDKILCLVMSCSSVLFVFTETTSGDQSTASNSGHSSSSSSSQSLNSAPGALGSTPSTMSSSTSSSSSSGQVPQSVQSPSPALLQDPALLHQLLPALQATLQMNNGSMDMAKLNEGKETAHNASSTSTQWLLHCFNAASYELYCTLRVSTKNLICLNLKCLSLLL